MKWMLVVVVVLFAITPAAGQTCFSNSDLGKALDDPPVITLKAATPDTIAVPDNLTERYVEAMESSSRSASYTAASLVVISIVLIAAGIVLIVTSQP